MLKNIIINSFTYFGRMVVTLFLGVICLMTLGLILPLLGIGEIIETICRVLFFTIITSAGLLLMSYNSYYKIGNMKFTEDIISGILMSGYQIMFAKIVEYRMYASGSAYFAAQLYYLLSYQKIPELYDIPQITFVVFMLLFDIIYIFMILLGSYLGVKKRLKDKKNLMYNSNN